MIIPIELVIWDCDGVLVDTERIAARVNVALGAELGWPLTEQQAIDRFTGRSPATNEALCAEHIGAERAARWRERFAQLHAQAVDAGLEPVDGVVEALDALTLPTCVASSGSHAKMRHTLGRTGLHDRFEGRIFSATEVAHGKPAPDLFLYAAERMGVPAASCVVVEDSVAGVQAARAAGMRVIGYGGGVLPGSLLEGPNTVVIDDMRQVPAVIESLTALA